MGYLVPWGRTAWFLIATFGLAAAATLVQWVDQGEFPTSTAWIAAANAGLLALMQLGIYWAKAMDPAIPPSWFPHKDGPAVEPPPDEPTDQPMIAK
jgi:hypothetical protein